MLWTQSCIYCQHSLYKLNDGMLKCSSCKKKYSPSRVNKILTLISAFSTDESTLSCSKRLHLSYICVQGYYKEFRHICAEVCETQYNKVRAKECEYEEYFYLAQSKKHTNKAIFDAVNFLTFDYEGHIYNILMPSLQKYKHQFLHDNLENVYANEFSKFKRKSHIIKLSKFQNNIEKFWSFFEVSVLHYKGISNEAFPMYLKEIEFKFNHTLEQKKEILQECYFKRRSK